MLHAVNAEHVDTDAWFKMPSAESGLFHECHVLTCALTMQRLYVMPRQMHGADFRRRIVNVQQHPAILYKAFIAASYRVQQLI